MSKTSSHDCLIFEDEIQLSLFDSDNKGSQKPTPPKRRGKTEGGLFKKPSKAQISAIPGTSPRQRDRYRVTLGDQTLGQYLDINEALELAAKGGK